MGNDRLLELISRKLAGETTAAELEEMRTILANDPSGLENYELLQQYWFQHEKDNQLFAEEAFEKLSHRLEMPAVAPVIEMEIPEVVKFGRRRQYTAAAAAMILVAGMFLFLTAGNKKYALTAHESRLVKKQNPKGSKQTFTLPDGSKVWLNADSRIQFPKRFQGSTREVHLSGEAFFSVVRNLSKPFIIHLANGTVSVLGTSFNVRAYENDKMVETSVATGKVAFIPKYLDATKMQDTVFVSPENKVRYLLSKEEIIIEPTTSKEDSAWIGGRLVFKAMTFEEIGMQLERTFGKKIVFVSKAVPLFRLTGAFQNNSLEEILFYLSKSKKFEYKITDEAVLISEENLSAR